MALKIKSGSRMVATLQSKPTGAPLSHPCTLMKWIGMQNGPQTKMAEPRLALFQARASFVAGSRRMSRRMTHQGAR